MIHTDWRSVGTVGLYTVPMAARLIGTDKPRLHAWLSGSHHSNAPPIIQRQLPTIGGKTALGFLDLIEARFVRHFCQWFSPQTIRKVSTKLRERHDVDHPFAMGNRFRTDGKAIFMESALDENERQTLNLMNDNFEMPDVIEQSLWDAIIYADDMARQWKPSQGTPRVIVDPTVAFGRPVIAGVNIPTETLRDAFLAEGGAEEAADEFGTDVDAVLQAIRFERELDNRTIH